MVCAQLIYEDNFLIIRNFDYHNEDAYYNTSFDIEVSSGNFKGLASCEYHFKDFKDFVTDLQKMYNFELQTVTLHEICYGSRIQFQADKTGHIEISGEIYGDAMEHRLKFIFNADQYVLKQFLSELQNMMAQHNT